MNAGGGMIHAAELLVGALGHLPGGGGDSRCRLTDSVGRPSKMGPAPRRARACRPRRFLSRRPAPGGTALAALHDGTFAGRVVARLLDNNGADLGAALLAAGLARPYAGRRRQSWCL